MSVRGEAVVQTSSIALDCSALEILTVEYSGLSPTGPGITRLGLWSWFFFELVRDFS